MKIAYGKNTPTSATDPEVIEMHRMVRMITGILRPGAYLVESLPWLKYLPWYGRDLKLGFERAKTFHLDQLNRVREKMVCFHSNLDFLSDSFHSRVMRTLALRS
jgi:hypothetical protein